jgi:hypothetical protein
MANKFIDHQEILDLRGSVTEYLTDEEAELTIRQVYGNDFQILSAEGGYVLYDGVSKRVVIDGVSVDLDDIKARSTWE